MNLFKCYLTQSPWYEEAKRGGTIVGVLWHDTGVNNTYIKRYVQPSDDDPNKENLLLALGVNKNGNDWNHTTRRVGVHAFIGRLADDSIATVQTGDFALRAWGCGSGENGSCNGTYKTESGHYYAKQYWLQFEICADDYEDADYFDAIYQEACEFTAYLCKLYNIDPKGTVDFHGVEVPTILCHKDSHDLGLGSNHGDVLGWFGQNSKTMQDVRDDVEKLLEPVDPPKFELLDVVKIKSECTAYSNGKNIPQWVKNSELYVRSFKEDNQITISVLKEGDVTGTVYEDDLELIRKHEENYKFFRSARSQSELEDTPINLFDLAADFESEKQDL